MMMNLRKDIIAYVEGKYKVTPDYPFAKYTQYAVLRHSDNQKWFGVIMDIPPKLIDIVGDSKIDILVIKVEPEIVEILKIQKGFKPAYHMNKKHWLTIMLDGQVDKKTIFDLLDDSFRLTR